MAERILCVLGKLKSGGVESIMCSYYSFLDKTKYQYDFIYEEGSDYDIPEELIKMGARAFKVPSVSNPVKYVGAIRKIIKKEGYRIVHSNLNSLSLFSLYAAKTCGVKYRILHNHTTSSPVERKRTFVKKLLRPFNVVLCNVSCACSELAAKWMYGEKAVRENKVKVLNNGVDIKKYRFDPKSRAEIRKEFNIENKTVIGHIGRFVTTKNHLFVIDLFLEYNKHNSDAVLMLVGDGELMNDVKSYAEERGVISRVIFTGVRTDAERILSAFDAFVLPSFYEGLPVVCVEACASGLPVILSDAVTRECAILDTVSFLPIDSPARWAEKLLAIEETDRFACNDKMENSRFDMRICAKELEALYAECK